MSAPFETVDLRVGQVLPLARLRERLVALGYQMTPCVSVPGDASVRGGVVDIYAAGFNQPLRLELADDRLVSIRSVEPASGEVLEEHAMAIVLPARGIAPHARRGRTIGLASAELPVDPFVDLVVGGPVVHVQHGIGTYRGVETVRGGGGAGEHLVIEYAGGDTLYVPVRHLHLVQRYVGLGHAAPKLHTLGTRAWERAKARARAGIRAYARALLELQARRALRPGHAFAPDGAWQVDFEREFPFEETPDQIRAWEEVRRDMEQPRPMDRVICGDVGYGKTEVALRAAFKAMTGEAQVALLVPTTLLAEQHYETFRQRCQAFPVRIELVSRLRGGREQAEILDALAAGRVDLVVGTHRLLSADVRFKRLGLVIIDEEQRFGVEHKEALKRLRLECDVLTLTATPIPRTLHMSLMGLKDLSVIATPPEARRPIETRVLDQDEGVIRSAILQEVERGGQVYVVHNRVEGIERVAQGVATLAPEARVGVGHGQLPPRELERVMRAFLRREIDVLVCTTIIQSGIDIPNVNTLIVNRADTFGLADLYQLRGRVGRFRRQAYAYLFVPRGGVLTAEAQQRLQAIQRHTALGSGFRIAMHDLELRGAGNLLGVEQHGYVMAVGFDLYCRLLRETIEDLRAAADQGAGAGVPAASAPAAPQRPRRGRWVPRGGVARRAAAWGVVVALASAGVTHAELEERIVAVVNEEVITTRDVAERLSPLVAQYGQLYGAAEFDAKVGEARQRIVDQLVEDRLILAAADELEIQVSEEEVEAHVQRVQDQFPSPEAFTQTMVQQGLTLGALRDRFREHLRIRQTVEQVVASTIVIGPAEIAEYYAAHEQEFRSPTAVHARHVLIRAAPVRDREAARKKAEGVLRQLRGGAPFARVAAEQSEGPNAADGGDLGFVEPGHMRPELDAAIFALEPGQLSHLVESPLGYHLFVVEERRAMRARSLEEVRDEIRERVFRERYVQRFTEWLAQLRDGAYISIR